MSELLQGLLKSFYGSHFFPKQWEMVAREKNSISKGWKVFSLGAPTWTLSRYTVTSRKSMLTAKRHSLLFFHFLSNKGIQQQYKACSKYHTLEKQNSQFSSWSWHFEATKWSLRVENIVAINPAKWKSYKNCMIKNLNRGNMSEANWGISLRQLKGTALDEKGYCFNCYKG